jgi:hypothetical protein
MYEIIQSNADRYLRLLRILEKLTDLHLIIFTFCCTPLYRNNELTYDHRVVGKVTNLKNANH